MRMVKAEEEEEEEHEAGICVEVVGAAIMVVGSRMGDASEWTELVSLDERRREADAAVQSVWRLSTAAAMLVAGDGKAVCEAHATASGARISSGDEMWWCAWAEAPVTRAGGSWASCVSKACCSAVFCAVTGQQLQWCPSVAVRASVSCGGGGGGGVPSCGVAALAAAVVVVVVVVVVMGSGSTTEGRALTMAFAARVVGSTAAVATVAVCCVRGRSGELEAAEEVDDAVVMRVSGVAGHSVAAQVSCEAHGAVGYVGQAVSPQQAHDSG